LGQRRLVALTALKLPAVASHHPRRNNKIMEFINFDLAELEGYGVRDVQKPVIVAHGGAGPWSIDDGQAALEWIKKAVSAGFSIMRSGGSAVDAVVEAVSVMEDSGVFNAGCGSILNLEGFIEVEASVMDGGSLKAGATALLRNVQNPVKLAWVIMNQTDHVMIAGDGAEKLARLLSLERKPQVSEKQLRYYQKLKQALIDGKFELQNLVQLIRRHPELLIRGTVGAVALDVNGNVAAATSTGGFPLKLPGRIGDSSIIGCGTYADNKSGACSVTGLGEIAIRLTLASKVCSYMESGMDAQTAVEKAVQIVNERIKEPYRPIGLIALDINGGIGAAHNTLGMCWAYLRSGMKEPVASLKAKMLC